MVGACQQNSGIFLVRGGGLGLEICGVRRRTGSETKLRVYCCEKQDGADGGAGDQITGQAADSERPGAGRDTGGNRGRNWDKMPTGAEAEQAGSSDKMPAGTEAGTGTRCRRGPRLSRQGARSGQRPDGMPAGAEAEQAGSSERPGTGRDTGGGRGRDWDEMPTGAEAEQARSKSTQKKALYNILQQSWIFQILLSCNNQIAVL